MSAIQVQAQTLQAPSAKRGLLRGVWAHLVAMYRTHEERQELQSLSDRDLRDFGANRIEMQREARRRFWDLPPMA